MAEPRPEAAASMLIRSVDPSPGKGNADCDEHEGPDKRHEKDMEDGDQGPEPLFRIAPGSENEYQDDHGAKCDEQGRPAAKGHAPRTVVDLVPP